MKIIMKNIDELIGPIENNLIGRCIRNEYIELTTCEGEKLDNLKSLLNDKKIKFELIPTDCDDCLPHRLIEVRIQNKEFIKKVLEYNPLFVYFITSSEGLIKIGLSSNPEKRLKTLQTASPYYLKLIYKMYGSRELEKYLHELFKQYHVKNEWFECSEVIIKFTGYKFIPSYIPNSKLGDFFE